MYVFLNVLGLRFFLFSGMVFRFSCRVRASAMRVGWVSVLVRRVLLG